MIVVLFVILNGIQNNMTDIAIYNLVLVHILYYAYGTLLAEVIKAGRMTTNKHIEIERLRKYGIPIKTFDYNGKLWGFATFKSIHLNERLLTSKTNGKSNAYYALRWVFCHEYYHVTNNHKLKSVLLRLCLSLSVLTMLVFPWWITLAIYIGIAVSIHYILEGFEQNANRYANTQMQKETLYEENY